ncbi:MAG: DUF4139 domain-containing protein, partial [Armatimonadetes bacterium]|nr:DUF4139 domain-containing protein [Armatimonadota bacterium]
EQLIGLTKFMFEQRTTLATQKVALAKSQRAAQEALTVLQRKRAELAGTVQRTAREAVLFVEAAAAKASSIELNYLVGGVYWSPAYVARLNGNRDKLTVEYHGVVSQMTGEDWAGVNLTLSTSQPNMTASAPILSPMWLALSQAGDAAQADEPAGYQNQRRELEQQLRGQNAPAAKPMAPATTAGGMMPGAPGPVARPQVGQPMTDDELSTNVLAAKLQNLEMAAGDEAIKATRRMKPAIAEGLAVDYAIPGKVSLASRNDQQMFRIAVLDLPAEAYYTASPLISDYVYQAVTTTNTTDTTLLPGPYNAYLDGAFAGRGNLPMVAKGEQVTLGFGTESQLRAVRDLQDKQTEIKGGNKVLTLTYSLRLQNFMAKPAKVRLWDRMPQAPNDQVTMTLADNGQPLSTDALYVEQEKPRGLLRWDLELPANATGTKALSFTFKVKLEFDKQMAVGELPEQTIERMRKDIDTLKELKR